ncbi:MAG TPA: histidinol-phosphate transaminase [Planctomycetes bacterium]|nr:histidinol-phosphate transaminase [Planctomycetota bacterium]
MKPSDLVRRAVAAVPAYRLVEEAAAVKLNQNESPWDVPPDVKEEIFARLRARPWNRYAQEAPGRVAAALAELNDWPVEGIVLGGGSNLLLEAATFAAVREGQAVCAPRPGFALYGLLAGLAGARAVTIPFGPGFAYDADAWCAAVASVRPALTFLCTPNNPTGSFMNRDGVRAVADACPGILVIDEAYREFAGEDRRDVLGAYDRVILSRTFSKAFSAAGVRLGYLLADPGLAAEIRKLVPPFNISILTATAAEVMLERRDLFSGRVGVLCAERERVQAALGGMAGVATFPSRANFFLVETPYDAEALAAEMKARGILVRTGSDEELRHMVRVNVGTREENDRFLAALGELMGGRP